HGCRRKRLRMCRGSADLLSAAEAGKRRVEAYPVSSHRSADVEGQFSGRTERSRDRPGGCDRARRGGEEMMEYINAFWVGGLICALAQILLDRTKLMPGRIMVLLVCTGAVLSFLGLYQPLFEYAGAGASVPLIGFGHLLFHGVKEA